MKNGIPGFFSGRNRGFFVPAQTASPGVPDPGKGVPVHRTALSLILGTLLLAGPAPVSANAQRVVTDQLGRSVSVPRHPRRVVALAPSITEIMYALGRQDCLQGATRYSDYPVEAARLPKVGSYVHLDLERIVALQPDLCIAVKDGNPLEAITRLQQLDIPVYAVSTFDLAAVLDSIERMGGLVHAEDRACDLVQALSTRIRRVQDHAAGATSKPRIFFQINTAPIVSIGTQTCIHRMIESAGGDNVTRGPTPYPRLSREQVIAAAPDVIVITSMGGGEAARAARDMWLQWRDIPAVRAGRVHIVESDLFDRPGPRMVAGLETLAKLLHPDMFSHADH